MSKSQKYEEFSGNGVSFILRSVLLFFIHLTFVESTWTFMMDSRGFAYFICLSTTFCRCIDSYSCILADTRAMYLSEIARMHAIFGDSKTAEQFYSVATETALEDCNSERRDRCINEATEQKQILLASIYDTG